MHIEKYAGYKSGRSASEEGENRNWRIHVHPSVETVSTKQ